jgi:hypothetical protein
MSQADYSLDSLPTPTPSALNDSHISNIQEEPAKVFSGGQVPGSPGNFESISSPTRRRHSDMPPLSCPQSAITTTGCCISAPISPPAHYPIPMSASSSSSSGNWLKTPASPKSISTSSTSSSSVVSSREPPRWALPVAHTNHYRAKSFGDAMTERPELDFDPELFEDPAVERDEEIEVIKGIEGRIAVKATKLVYEIMVWLPGFT